MVLDQYHYMCMFCPPPEYWSSQDVYGAGYTQHLSNAAADSEQLHAMVCRSLLAPFWASMRHTPVRTTYV
jgi:hypothetical protein